MRTEVLGGGLGSRETYEAVVLNAQERATLRNAENLLYRLLDRIGAEAKRHDPELADLDDHDAAIEVLPEDDPLASAAAFLSELSGYHFEPGTLQEYRVPGSSRPAR